MSENTNEPPPRMNDFAEGGSRNPFGDSNAVAIAPTAGLVSVEQRKVMAEVQARILMARSMPRDPVKCADLILRDCTRPSLAEKALYSYARGGSDITGPSIRLAEAVAQRWGNLASGIKELSRSNGYSECVAYAWDLEAGYYDERQFQVRHWRDTKSGGYAVKDERDIYEMTMNAGQRRKRAVLLAVIPGDVIEMAVQECERTLHAAADTSPDAMLKMVEAFDKLGVTRPQIEKRIQRRIDAIRPAQVVQLRKIYASLMDEMSTAEEWFEATEGNSAWAGVEGAHQAQRPTVNPPTTRKTAAKKAAASAADTPAESTRTAEAKTPAPEKPVEDDGIPFDRWEPPGSGAVAQDGRNGGASPPDGKAGAAHSTGQTAPPPTAGETPATAAFEQWLLDENGDPTKDEPERDPMAFAVALSSAIDAAPENRVNLLSQNADGIDAAKALNDIAVTNVLTSLEAAVISPAENEPPAEPEAPGAIVVELHMDRGKPVAGRYIKDFKEAVGALVEANWLDFIDLNKSTMMRVEPSSASLLLKALAERAKMIGVAVPPDLAPSLLQRGKSAPSPESTAPAEDPDWQTARHRAAEIKAVKDVHEFNSMLTGIVLKNFGERMLREGKTDIIAFIKAAADEVRTRYGVNTA